MIEIIDEYNQYAYFKHKKENKYYREKQSVIIPERIFSDGLLSVSSHVMGSSISFSRIEYVNGADWVEPCTKQEFENAIQQFLTANNLQQLSLSQ